MAFGTNQGALFIGALSQVDKAFIVPLLRAAKEDGYTKMVEPCAGQLDMSVIAADLGYTNIEASDVTIFSGVVGRFVEGRSIEDMGIVQISTGETIDDPIDALYEIKKRELEDAAGSVYGMNMLQDLLNREAEIKEGIKEKLENLKARIPSLLYRDMDVFEHLAEVKDDENAIVLCWCPTYKGGYEKFYKAVDETLSWNEPTYQIFDPSTMYADLYGFMEDAKCLFIMIEETEQNKCVGEPIYARPSSRIGVNRYLVANRQEEAERLVGKCCKPKSAQKISPSKYHLIHEDHEISEKSTISVVKIDAKSIKYYRELLTHNFVPSDGGGDGLGVIVDGYLAGIFGYMASLANGIPSRQCISYAMAAHHNMRLLRLVYMAGMQRKSLNILVSDLWAASCDTILTKIISKYPSSVTMRGLMKLVAREKDDRLGYFLSYECPIQDRELNDVLQEFLKKERRWQKVKGNTKS